MTLSRIQNILQQVKFNDWTFVSKPMGDGFYIQVQFHAPDNHGEGTTEQHGGKYYISKHAIKDEIIKTAWKAVISAVEHEAREQFLYCGIPIFDPHTSCDRLLELHRQGCMVSRPKAPQNAEELR